MKWKSRIFQALGNQEQQCSWLKVACSLYNLYWQENSDAVKYLLVRKLMVILVMSGGIRFSDLKPLKQSIFSKIQNGYYCTSRDIVFNISNKKNESGVSRGEIVDDYLKKLKANLPHLNDNSPLFLCGKPSFFFKIHLLALELFKEHPIGFPNISGRRPTLKVKKFVLIKFKLILRQ